MRLIDKSVSAFTQELASPAPVPGGVGSVTTCVLIGHVAEAAKRSLS